MVARRRLPPLRIDGGEDRKRDDGRNRQGSAIGWPKSSSIIAWCGDVAGGDRSYIDGRGWSQKIIRRVRKLSRLTDGGVRLMVGRKTTRNDGKRYLASASRLWRLWPRRRSVSVSNGRFGREETDGVVGFGRGQSPTPKNGPKRWWQLRKMTLKTPSQQRLRWRRWRWWVWTDSRP